MCDTGLPEPASSELTAHLVEVGMRALRDQAAAKRPVVIEMPENVSVEAAANAIAICQQLGVLADHGGAGWLLLPTAVTRVLIDD